MLTHVHEGQKTVISYISFWIKFFRNWQCILHLTFNKDVYKVFVKYTFVGHSKTKALVTKSALNDGKFLGKSQFFKLCAGV